MNDEMVDSDCSKIGIRNNYYRWTFVEDAAKTQELPKLFFDRSEINKLPT